MGVNRVILLGNLGQDPEIRYTQSQQAVCNLRIATTERRQTPEGEWKEFTEWHSVVVWGKTAENCAQYLSKGKQVYLEGRLQTRKWQDRDGKDRYTTEVVASTVQFIGNRGDGLSNNVEKSSAPARKGRNADALEMPSGAGSSAPSMNESIALDDDEIPF